MNAAARSKPAARKASGKNMDLVYGLGSTGLSVARYLRRCGVDARYVDSRENPPGVDELVEIWPGAETVLGRTPNALLKKSARMIVSPGIADSDDYLQAARKADIEIVSDIELFVQEAKAPIVAVTGSNGKSTVTTLLFLMCKAAGKNGLAGANLGVPALDLLLADEPDYYLLELSSFQLQRTSNLPAKVSVLLNISADHLDWHENEYEYRQAKYRVFDQADGAVINRADSQVGDHLPKKIRTLSFGMDEPEANQYGLRAADGNLFLACGDQLLLSVSDVAMVGAHNRANALAALACGEMMGLDMSSMLQVLNEFPGLPHRMQSAGRIGGVQYINDSKATNVGAAIASVESVDGLVVLIAGGQGKGGNFDEFATSVCSRLRAVVLIGEDAQQLNVAFTGLSPTSMEADMDAAVNCAAGIAESGDTVLLAPACASFDQYRNYQDRGEDFCRAVEALPR
jgi:UDP-N-acetylmuramoylalanine--D-glutamate ligase